MSQAAFPDHFSAHAPLYARARPRYPEALFAWLAGEAPHRRLAWDAGTGSGQAAVALAGHFAQVVATDASASQLAEAEPHRAVEYRALPAEASPVPRGGAAAVTAAQAAHWFQLERFFAAADDALSPGGLLALWGYDLLGITPEVDRVVERLYHETLGAWWPPQRALVEDGYRALTLPFPDLAAPAFCMEVQWDLDGLRAYLGSWSATRRYAAAQGRDPVAEAGDALAAAWGDPARVRTVRFPLFLRAARKPA